MFRFNLIQLCFFTLVACQAQGQTTTTTPSANRLSKKEQRQAKREEEAKKKPDYDPAILGHAYFGSEEWVPATVWYDGAKLQSTPIRYDLVRDELTLPPDDPDAPAHKFRLLSEKVDSFAVSGHTFIRLSEEAGVPEGFYDKLYDGDVKVFVRREKYIYQENTYSKVNHRFLTEDRYYLYKDGKYHLIKGRSALLKALKDKQKNLELYIRKEQLPFKNNLEQDLVKVAAYYDSLKQK